MEGQPHIPSLETVVSLVSRRLGPGEAVNGGHRWVVRGGAPAPLVVMLVHANGALEVDVSLHGEPGGKCLRATLGSMAALEHLLEAVEAGRTAWDG
jgi:hypothetical protein